MVPRRPLLVLVALTVVPLLGLATLQPANAMVSLAPILLVMAICTWDAWRGWSTGSDVRVEVPEIVRLAKGREESWQVQLIREGREECDLRLGLPFPNHLGVRDAIVQVHCNQGEQKLAATFQCQPLESGMFAIDACYLETKTPFGLWARRRKLPLALELRVNLDLMRERKVMAALFLNRESTGIHAQRQLGQGRDFEKLRRFISGDSQGDIHWKATAKRSFLVTKQFRVERTQEIYVLVDRSRLSARPAIPEHYGNRMAEGEQITVLERYLTSALLLGLAAEKQGDLFGVVGFANKVNAFVRAKAGRNHYGQCREALFGMVPHQVSPDFDELFTFLRQKLRRRALLMILTHLDDPLTAESFAQNIHLIARKHLVVVAMIKDRQMKPLFSGEPVSRNEEVYEALGAHLRWRNLKEIGNVLSRKGVRFSLLENESLCLDLMTQYINIKQRQLI